MTLTRSNVEKLRSYRSVNFELSMKFKKVQNLIKNGMNNVSNMKRGAGAKPPSPIKNLKYFDPK